MRAGRRELKSGRTCRCARINNGVIQGLHPWLPSARVSDAPAQRRLLIDGSSPQASKWYSPQSGDEKVARGETPGSRQTKNMRAGRRELKSGRTCRCAGINNGGDPGVAPLATVSARLRRARAPAGAPESITAVIQGLHPWLPSARVPDAPAHLPVRRNQ